jgi:hypothetical protein
MERGPAETIEDKLRHASWQIAGQTARASEAVESICDWAGVEGYWDAVQPLLQHFTAPPYNWKPAEVAEQDVITLATMLPKAGKAKSKTVTPRYKPEPCPKCDGKVHVKTSGPKGSRTRSLVCEKCGHSRKESKSLT